ncbi:MAG: hypothetical protein ABFS12_14670, partial [Bacteroidota bacterium]
IIGCDNSISPEQSYSEKKVIIDGERYKNAPNDSFSFTNVEIIDDCIKLTIQYGGGCGNIKVNLYDSGVLAMSNPPQKYLRLSLKDMDNCEALITKVLKFELSSIQSICFNKVILNIDGWGKQIEYDY